MICNGGYQMVDLKGLDTTGESQTKTGLHEELQKAMKNGKPGIFYNLENDGEKIGAFYSECVANGTSIDFVVGNYVFSVNSTDEITITENTGDGGGDGDAGLDIVELDMTGIFLNPFDNTEGSSPQNPTQQTETQMLSLMEDAVRNNKNILVKNLKFGTNLASGRTVSPFFAVGDVLTGELDFGMYYLKVAGNGITFWSYVAQINAAKKDITDLKSKTTKIQNYLNEIKEEREEEIKGV